MPVSAEPVKLENAAGNVITADYSQGTDRSNPVLVLHGFLQTGKFSTVSRLLTSLHDIGYTVLSPTLSLGVSNRKQSLSCEAIHTHSLDTDADELRQWVEWLYEKTGKPVILIAHSAGGPVILKYMEASNAKYVAHSILISLSFYNASLHANENSEYAEKAQKAINAGINPLDTYALSYCKTYPTDARSFLSYYNWDRVKTSAVINKFSDRVSIILGTGDKRMEDSMKKQLQEQHSNVIMIEGANHFFDQAHEFDLTDAIEELLSVRKGL
jgi:alpha-beta hydrolase superfamily lysophospholipase